MGRGRRRGGTADAPVIEAEQVTRRFGSFTAVDEVSLTVSPGEIVGLLGANGAGKTTLIRMLLGLLRPTEGSVRLLGVPPSRRTRQRLGYVPQGLGLYGDLSIGENVEFVTRSLGSDVRTDSLPAELASMPGRPVREIGLGRQRQLAFACATGHRPAVLVLDEPTSGVDPLARARLWDRTRAEADRGAAVLVTTHYMQEAEQCDRLVMMAAGRVSAAGTVHDIVSNLTTTEITGASWSDTFAALTAAGFPITLDGRRIRVPGVPTPEIESALATAGVAATAAEVPARLDEAMAWFDRR